MVVYARGVESRPSKGFGGGAVTCPGWSGEAAVAGVDQKLHVGVVVDEVVDAFGAYGGLVVLAAGADGSGPQRSAEGLVGQGQAEPGQGE